MKNPFSRPTPVSEAEVLLLGAQMNAFKWGCDKVHCDAQLAYWSNYVTHLKEFLEKEHKK